MITKPGESLLSSKQNSSHIIAQPGARKSSDARVAYTAQEAAEKLGVSRKTISRFRDRGLLQASKATRKLLFAAEAVENFIKETI